MVVYVTTQPFRPVQRRNYTNEQQIVQMLRLGNPMKHLPSMPRHPDRKERDRFNISNSFERREKKSKEAAQSN